MTRRIIGCGNPFRRDDGAGVAVARRLKSMEIAGAEIQEASGEAADLMERLKGAGEVILVDAMRSGLPPGTVRAFAPFEKGLEDAHFSSTHEFGLPQALALAQVLGTLPGKTTIYGIEGADFTEGEGLSPEVEAAAERLAGLLAKESCTNKS